MKKEKQKELIETLEKIAANGRTVAEYFGNQGAAIAALAKIMKALIEDK